uniref:Uncharacterized protein n=1 Tax=Cannabis sativa TaxID=3483 RepID=A0A803RBC3_CANSA
MKHSMILVSLLLVVVMVLNLSQAKGSRLLPADCSIASNNHHRLRLRRRPFMYEKSRKKMMMMSRWFQQLESGPSPRGPGH